MSKLQILNNNQTENIIYFVKTGDTMVSVAKKFCVLVESLASDNDLTKNYNLELGDILWIRRKNTAIYVVKPCDTIASIAKLFDVSEQHIKSLNGITNVFVGQKIII